MINNKILSSFDKGLRLFGIGLLLVILASICYYVYPRLGFAFYHLAYIFLCYGFGLMECRNRDEMKTFIIFIFFILLLMNVGPFMSVLREQYFNYEPDSITFDDPWILGK